MTYSIIYLQNTNCSINNTVKYKEIKYNDFTESKLCIAWWTIIANINAILLPDVIAGVEIFHEK